MTPQEFISKYALIITESTQGTRLFPSVAIAQAALETGWGKTIDKAANNMFGIKATASWKGKVKSLTTKEHLNGNVVTFVGTGQTYNSYAEAVAAGADKQTLFRAYLTIGESIRDHNKLITESPRYAQAMLAATPQQQIEAIKAAGYATATNYVGTIKSIIAQHNLETYDKKKGNESCRNYFGGSLFDFLWFNDL